MGPAEPGLHAVGGTDDDGDDVKRCKAFTARHRAVSVLSPRATGTGLFHATWPEGDEGDIMLATHEQLGPLLDYLEARFG